MQRIAPLEKDTTTDTLEKRLWDAAAKSRATPVLTPPGHSGPILRVSFSDALHDTSAPFDFPLAKPLFGLTETEPFPSLQPG
jgi:hypothetical protein